MARKKLVSIRLDESNLEAAEKLAGDMRYWTRSAVIDGILSCVFSCADTLSIQRMVRWTKFTDKGEKVTFIQES